MFSERFEFFKKIKNESPKQSKNESVRNVIIK